MNQLGLWPWLFLLGAYHGVNPGMGWLFAVALGLQQNRRRAVVAALPPIVLGHAISVGLVVVLLGLAEVVLAPALIRFPAAAILFAFGLYRLFRARHPRWAGMRVGFGDLTLWSFLMASSHGAGLMLVPLLLGSWRTASLHHAHELAYATAAGQALAGPDPTGALLAVAAHTLGYLLVMALVALLVYEKFGVAFLRQAWLNLDLLWAIALLASGLLTLLI